MVAAKITASIAGLALLLAASARAQDPRPSQTACDRSKLGSGRAYVECLEAAVRTADEAMRTAHERARAAIDARGDLAPMQRTRWKNALEEAMSAFITFRNIECQNVAPYEGGGRIGVFEQRLACLIDKATTRAHDLDMRYGKR
jgi:uncharacterized protein YecT (DUF1311 family)